jgi:hypothetical protein
MVSQTTCINCSSAIFMPIIITAAFNACWCPSFLSNYMKDENNKHVHTQVSSIKNSQLPSSQYNTGGKKHPLSRQEHILAHHTVVLTLLNM